MRDIMREYKLMMGRMGFAVARIYGKFKYKFKIQGGIKKILWKNLRNRFTLAVMLMGKEPLPEVEEIIEAKPVEENADNEAEDDKEKEDETSIERLMAKVKRGNVARVGGPIHERAKFQIERLLATSVIYRDFRLCVYKKYAIIKKMRNKMKNRAGILENKVMVIDHQWD